MSLVVSSSFVRVLLTTSLLAVASAATAHDYDAYFGGTDHGDYLSWVETVSYDRSIFLRSADPDPADGVAIHWNIVINDDNSTITSDGGANRHDGEIEVAVAVRATGWVGTYVRTTPEK